MTDLNENIDFALLKDYTRNLNFYHNTIAFKGAGNLCDVYFNCKNHQITKEQIENFESFSLYYPKYIKELKDFLHSNLFWDEKINGRKIKEIELSFNVLEIPTANLDYDVLLYYGKTYRNFLFYRKTIDIKVKFRKGNIISITRTRRFCQR